MMGVVSVGCNLCVFLFGLAAGQDLFLSPASTADARVDTEYWIGAEYRPAAAPSNGLWFHWYDDYATSVDRELPLLRRHLHVTAVRVWLHSMVFANNSARLLTNMDRFLSSCAKENISVGFVFFGDCWNFAGASLSNQCVPRKGVHNGCWFASPQEVDRHNGYELFKPYVSETIRRFKDDSRVLWWEIFNEPKRSNPFSLGLRDAGYRWAKAESPQAPVLANWDDNNNTDIIDHHDYGTTFTNWKTVIYSNEKKGAFVTEAGSRWFQPQPIGAVNQEQSDQGSPLTVLNFLSALREGKKKGVLPYVPGVMLCWTLMVGNDNTRWHWGTQAGSAEPAIPWDGLLFPDGTPVSHTEAAAFRRYVTSVDEFLIFNDFLPAKVADGDVYQKVSAGEKWTASSDGSVRDALFEASLWVDGLGDGVVTFTVRSQNATLPQKQMASGKQDSCTQDPKSVWHDTDISGSTNYYNLDVTKEADPAARCSAACCAQNDSKNPCIGWIVRDLNAGEDDKNCAYAKGTRTCCWMKPDGSDMRIKRANSTAGVVHRPPPPPGPAAPITPGYAAQLDAKEKKLAVLRRDTTGSEKVLGSVDLSQYENGVVLDAWSLLRIVVSDEAEGARLRVWFNPIYTETGFVGDSSDSSRAPRPLPPRLTLVDPSPLPAGSLAVAAGNRDTRIDYVSALPISVL